jgi:glycoprotein-N-acetylgalactosamine 3-beta-galactosyltransferase
MRDETIPSPSQELPLFDKVNVTMLVQAFDALGRPGYVADPTFLRKQQQQQQQQLNATLNKNTRNDTNKTLIWEEVCDIPPGLAEEGPQGLQGLWKIRQGLLLQQQQRQQEPQNHHHHHHPRVLCLVYTHSNRHDTALRAIVDTWGVDCDGFLAISNQTHAPLGAVHIYHPGTESYRNMWQKVRHAWMYVHEHYRNDYDWFHMGGDDHYVVVPNLRRFVATLMMASSDSNNNNTEDEQQPLYLGSSMVDYKVRYRFCGGGAGYTLNRAALQLLSEALPNCFANTTTSEEDRCIGRCLYWNPRNVTVLCQNSNDELDEQRYHAMDVQFHAAYYTDRKVPWDAKALKRKHNITTTQIGLKQISQSSISFHLTSAMVESRHADRGMRRYHALLFGKCDGMDVQMKQLATYNTTYLIQQLEPEFRKNREMWGDLRDKCAEVIRDRDQRLTGNIARKYCNRAARRRKVKRNISHQG